ncbi:serine protease [Paramagnetospirillum caucaseum]|uniref:serine protease n=1 Tax=Paramagnetospirillum caucaseum TaxID=1244869 RepID=UPI000347D175|nr:serine protease [Paramagnetospirillum caucaseum]
MFFTRKTVGLAVGILALSGIALAAPESNPIPSMELARSLIDAEQFEQAVAILKQLDAGEASTSAQIDLLFGRIYLSIGKPAKALGFFEEASFASLDGEAEAYLGLAEADLALGDLAKARRNATLALKSDPDLIAAHLVLARADQRIGKAAEAATRLRQLQRDRENSEDVAITLARFLAQQDGPTAGIAELERFARQVPTSAGAYDVLGQMIWATGRKAEAVQARDTARQLYLDRGQIGRSEAMAAWIKVVDPQGKWKAQEATVEEPSKPIPPEPQKTIPPKEPPPPKAQPRPPVEAAPAPPPPPRKVTQAVALAQPEPFPFAPGSPILTGSGVVLEGGRQIITNRHVVEGITTLYVRNGTGHVRKARIAKVSNEDDLALLEIDKAFPEGAVTPIADIVQPTAGRAAIVMGYPLISLLGDEQPALTEGIVAKAAGLGNDPNTFQMTTKINKGNSGGPVFDKRGHLLGVAVGKTDSAAVYQKTGTQMEDMNIGIKGGRILAFLGKTAAAVSTPPEMSLEDLYQQMLPRAVLIVGQK